MNHGNIFSSLEEDFIDNEIQNDNELRNKKKTLQKKLKKKLNGTSESLLREIRILQTLISEYEESQSKSSPQEKKKNKNKQNKKSSASESDDFLEREYNKHKETNQKRYKEQKEKEEREKEEKKRREEQRREQRQEQKRREEYSDDEETTISDILGQHQMKINDLPEDITPLINNYDHTLYRKLSVKYHPDKYPDDKFCKLLNCIKDFYQN